MTRTLFPRAAATATVLAGLIGTSFGAHAAEARPGLKACRLPGVTHDAYCGVLRRPLDPAQQQGPQIDLHYAVLPALARNRKPDPVMFFAGGPGQSAMALAGPVARMLKRLSNRRDVVLIDQRGTGRSAPLLCDELPPGAPLAEAADTARQIARMQACGVQLQKLPHGDLRHYTTWVAMQDADAVRQALGAPQVNVVGGSYGTRAVLEYARQFPQAVRRVVIDGVAPPDMVMPVSFSTDNQAALDAVFQACEAEDACRRRHPTLRTGFTTLLAGLPRDESVTHPLTGRPERVTLTREWVLGLVRGPLYAPSLAAALPQAMDDAASGRFEGLLGLASAFGGGGRAMRLAEGMHFSVVCAEDMPRLAQAADAPGADFADAFAAQYRRICDGWPRGAVPAAFYTLPPAPAATLVLSGGADPVTPPRHGERVAKALGVKARHVVVPQAGHGVMALPCMRNVLFRFIDAETDEAALQVAADCARGIPRPPAFVPLLAEGVK
ncbi:MAG: alpha/beta fold hydrolase [Betaproteobacteria bacterium]|nr:alpha/beta fold hydrolase [Betaproteobacteria bacterium]